MCVGRKKRAFRSQGKIINGWCRSQGIAMWWHKGLYGDRVGSVGSLSWVKWVKKIRRSSWVVDQFFEKAVGSV